MTRQNQGRYIVIEGHDGTGKTTQVSLAAEWLRNQGRTVTIVEEPGSDDPEKSTPVATKIRHIIVDGTLQRDPEINVALFSAARRELWQHKIAPALAAGHDVLSSRNYYSTIAYQGYGEGVSISEIEEMTRLFTDERYMNPDIVVLLMLEDNTERSHRIGKRGELEKPDPFETKGDEFQNRIHEGYGLIATDFKLPTISAKQSIESIRHEIQTLLKY